MVNAQTIKVTYEESINTESALQQVDNPQIAALVAKELKSMTKSSSLTYHLGTSIYKTEVTASSADNAITYKDFKANKRVSQESILDREFLIEDELPKLDWKLEKDTEEILGYTCHKATNSKGVTAWYCSELPINDGPASYYGLPGLVLKVESTTKLYIATGITTKNVNTANVVQPTKGKKISREEFDKTKAEKLKEFGVQGGSKGIKVITM